MKRVRLKDAAACARELAWVYSKAKAAEIPTADANRLASILLATKACLESSAVESRITRIEECLGTKAPVVALVKPDRLKT